MKSWQELLLLENGASVRVMGAVAVVCLLLGGCESGTFVPTSPTPRVPAVPTGPFALPTTVVREIAVGDTVEGLYTYCFGACTNNPTDELHFAFTAPADGIVGVTLAWDVWWAGAIFFLTLDGVPVPEVPRVWSPLAGEMSVTAGTRYTIAVGLCCADEQFEDHPLVLSTEWR